MKRKSKMSILVVALTIFALDMVGKALWAEPIYTEVAIVGDTPVPLLILVLISCISFALIWFKVRPVVPAWATGLLLGGVASNFYDRVVYGGRRDYISTVLLVWNLADFAIIAGVYMFLRHKNGGDTNAKDQGSSA